MNKKRIIHLDDCDVNKEQINIESIEYTLSDSVTKLDVVSIRIAAVLIEKGYKLDSIKFYNEDIFNLDYLLLEICIKIIEVFNIKYSIERFKNNTDGIVKYYFLKYKNPKIIPNPKPDDIFIKISLENIWNNDDTTYIIRFGNKNRRFNKNG